MKYTEYGTENKDVILLLHGGGLSWWSFREAAMFLQERYHVILPVLDGHAGSDHDFVSIEQSASSVIGFIDEYCGGSVLAVGGLSLGAQVVVDMLAQRSDLCRYAFVESALLIPMKTTGALIGPMLKLSYGLISRKWFSRLQFWSLGIKSDLYPDYYADSCRISQGNMLSFLKANLTYQIPAALSQTKASVSIAVGSREAGKMIASAKKLHHLLPNSQLTILQGMMHGAFSINHAEEYAAWIENIIE